MAVEQFANDYATTLDGGIAYDDATLTLASATGAPAAPFRVRIEDELILVGARTTTACSSLTRGVEGTTAAGHLTGVAVTHVLTAAGLETVRGVIVQDEGSPLATTGTTLNFTGGGVVASGSGTTKTIAISGASVADILDLPTAEDDTALVLAPDGTGGVEFRAEAGGGGGLILLEQHTAANSATLDFTTFISSTYDTYHIEVVDISPVSNAVNFLVQVGTGGGPTWDTGNNYESAAFERTTSGNSHGWNAESGAGAILFLSASNNAGYGACHATYTVKNLASTAHRKTIYGTFYYVSSTPAAEMGCGGMDWITAGTAVTALRFLFDSGNIASGTIRVYGMAK